MDIKTPIKERFGKDVASIIYEYIFDTCCICKVYYNYEWVNQCKHCSKMVCNDCMKFHGMCSKKKVRKRKRLPHKIRADYAKFMRSVNKNRK